MARAAGGELADVPYSEADSASSDSARQGDVVVKDTSSGEYFVLHEVTTEICPYRIMYNVTPGMLVEVIVPVPPDAAPGPLWVLLVRDGAPKLSVESINFTFVNCEVSVLLLRT